MDQRLVQAQIDCLNGVADGLEVACGMAPVELVPGMTTSFTVIRGVVEKLELELIYDRS